MDGWINGNFKNSHVLGAAYYGAEWTEMVQIDLGSDRDRKTPGRLDFIPHLLIPSSATSSMQNDFLSAYSEKDSKALWRLQSTGLEYSLTAAKCSGSKRIFEN